MIEPPLLMRIGAAASILGHMAVLTLGLLFADADLFESAPSEAISVDIVTPEEAKALPKPADPPKPIELPQPDPIDFSQMLPQQPGSQTPPPPKSQSAAASASPPNPPPPAQQAAASQQAARSQGAEAPQSMPSSQTPSQPASQPPPSPPAPEPDITVKYGIMLGLPSEQENSENSGFEPRATDTAKIETSDIAAFRRHLKTCSSLPASVAPTDKVRIVLRVLLSRDGTLTAEPALLEASASVKGPVLMQRAMAALQACQPYTMLPADKYTEWKVLDLSFTPQDFTGG
jgi:outer membrane biosynthesis protein TonB